MGRLRWRPKQRGNQLSCNYFSTSCLLTRDVLFFVSNKKKTTMETRVALIGIIVDEPDSVAPLNELLHEYRQYIIGRMGIPYKPRNISVISVTLDAPMDVISSLSGKLGMLKGVTSKALMAKL